MQRALCIAGLAACVAALAAAAPRAAAAQDHPNITPGKWELSIKQEFDMPGFKGGPPMTTTTCIKPEQVQSNQSFAERMTQRNGDKAGANSKCVYSGFTATASQVSFSFSCENGPTGQSEIKFAGDTYEITTHATAPSRGGSAQEMHFTQHISGKRIGDC